MQKIYILLVYLYRKLNSLKVLIGSFAAFVVLVTIMSVISAITLPGKGVITFSLEFARSASEFTGIAHQLGADAINAYKKLLIIDSFFPFAYVTFLASIIALLSSRRDGEIKETALFFFSLPFLGGILDWIENASHLLFLSDLSAVTDAKVEFSTLVSTVKWALTVIATLYIALILARLVFGESFSPLMNRTGNRSKKDNLTN